MDHCLEPQTLADYAAGTLAADADTRAEQHLRECRRCAGALDRLVDQSREGRELLEQVRAVEAGRAAGTERRIRVMAMRVSTTLFGADAAPAHR